MTRTRITVTIPEEVLRAADQRATELDRSRSWLVSEALRSYLGEADETGATPPAQGPTRARRAREPEGAREPEAARLAAIREAAARGYGPGLRAGLGPYREERLRADLALSPERRVEEAERAARVAELRGPRPLRARVITFQRYEEYLDWERREDLRA